MRSVKRLRYEKILNHRRTEASEWRVFDGDTEVGVICAGQNGWVVEGQPDHLFSTWEGVTRFLREQWHAKKAS